MPGILNSNTVYDLGFDEEVLGFVERDLRVSLHLADGYFREGIHHEEYEQREKYLGFAATLYRRASAHVLLLHGRGDFLFHSSSQAVMAYLELGMPYALLLAPFLPSDANAIVRLRDNQPAYTNKRVQLIYTLLYYAAQQVDVDPHLRYEMDSYRSRPIGILGLPVGTYLDLIDTLIGLPSSHLNVGEAIFPFIASYDDAIRRAISNRYLWQQLSHPFHPAELDLFGLLLLTQSRVESSLGESLTSFFSKLPLARPTRILLEGIIGPFFESGPSRPSSPNLPPNSSPERWLRGLTDSSLPPRLKLT